MVERFLGWVERIGDGYHFVILDFLVAPLDPEQAPVAGDDADEVAWVPLGELDGVRLVDGLFEFLVDHGIVESAEPVDLGFEPPP